MDSKILFEYSQALRDRYLEQLVKLPWEEVVKSRGGSFDSLRNIFLHTVDAEDRLVNYVILGRTEDWASQSPDEFRDMDSISRRAKEVDGPDLVALDRILRQQLREITGRPAARENEAVATLGSPGAKAVDVKSGTLKIRKVKVLDDADPLLHVNTSQNPVVRVVLPADQGPVVSS